MTVIIYLIHDWNKINFYLYSNQTTTNKKKNETESHRILTLNFETKRDNVFSSTFLFSFYLITRYLINITIIKLTYSGFNFLSPPLKTVLSSFSNCWFKYSSSFNLNSSAMISRSLTGLTSPSTCVTSSSSKAP